MTGKMAMLWDVLLVTRNSVLFFWSAADPEDNHGAGGCARAWVEGYVGVGCGYIE
jgi:hypothetical protein